MWKKINYLMTIIHIVHVLLIKIIEWKNYSKKITEKWCEVFKILEKDNISSIEYSLAIPSTNASVERIYSIINVL